MLEGAYTHRADLQFPKEAAWGIALGSAGGAGCSPSVQPLAITQGVECGQVVPSSPEQFPRKRRRSTPGMPALETGTSGSQVRSTVLSQSKQLT